MSAHYAMCKYDNATGSYIPLEVRPITDNLKKDDPLYQEGFQAGSASRDAEIAAEQAKNAELLSIVWEANKYLDQTYADLIGNIGSEWLISRIVDHLSPSLSKALSQPSDTSALEALIKQAGEVMRKKCADASIDLYSERSTFEAIHALPAVTLEDLK